MISSRVDTLQANGRNQKERSGDIVADPKGEAVYLRHPSG